jgi:hypothetical protein
MLRGALAVGVNTWRNNRLSFRRLVVHVANVATPAALVDGDDRSALATGRVVDSVLRAFHRHEVYRLAAVEYGEVRQDATGLRLRVAPMPSPCQSRASDEDSDGDGPEVHPEAQVLHRHSGPSIIAVSPRVAIWAFYPSGRHGMQHCRGSSKQSLAGRHRHSAQSSVLLVPQSFAAWPIRNHCV